MERGIVVPTIARWLNWLQLFGCELADWARNQPALQPSRVSSWGRNSPGWTAMTGHCCWRRLSGWSSAWPNPELGRTGCRCGVPCLALLVNGDARVRVPRGWSHCLRCWFGGRMFPFLHLGCKTPQAALAPLHPLLELTVAQQRPRHGFHHLANRQPSLSSSNASCRA